MTRLLAFMAAMAGVLCLFASSAIAQDSVPKGISVNGNGEASGVPDIARINIGVQTEDKDATKATADNAAKIQRLIGSIVAGGVDKKDIQTTQYSLQPMYDYKTSPPKLTGYQVTNSLRVTVRDLSKAGNIIDRAIGAGANAIQGISYEIENDDALRNEALTKAVQQARAKAQAMAKALDVSLGALRAANESVSSPGYPPTPFMSECLHALSQRGYGVIRRQSRETGLGNQRKQTATLGWQRDYTISRTQQQRSPCNGH